MTLTELQDAIDDTLGESVVSLPDASKTRMINMAQHELCRMDDFPWQEATVTTAIAAGTRAYALPAGFSRPWFYQYIDPSNSENTITMEEKDWDEMLVQYGALQTQSSGRPEFYAIWAGSLNLFPTPDFTGNIYGNYYKILTDLSAGADHNDLTDIWWPLLLYKSLALCSAYLLEDERATALWEAAYQGELKKVREEVNRRLRAGRGLEQLQEPG